MIESASRAPVDLPGLDPRFSRTREAMSAAEGISRGWHYLDTEDELRRIGVTPVGTMLAVHGNPTWSYLWRRVISASVSAAEHGRPAWRVIAVDQLDMGFSERTGAPRPLAQRVADLADLTATLQLEGPVVTLGHDWGGVVALGWAVDHPDSLAGVMMLNTAVHHPEGTPIPFPLRLAGSRGVLATATVATTAFLETTLALAHPTLDPGVRDAYRAPYRTAARRRGIGAFVADIPVDAGHPSFTELTRIADGVAALEVPALLLWGPEDPIFSDKYLDDLVERMPHADVHRFEKAGHLLAEDREYADVALDWLLANHDAVAQTPTSDDTDEPATTAASHDGEAPWTPLWAALDERREDDAVAVIDMSRTAGDGGPSSVGWRLLHDRVQRIAAGLQDIGVVPGQRVSLLIPPGPTLTAVLYACLRIGAVVVVADAGLGIAGLTRAVRGAQPDVVIGELPGLIAARALGWPGTRISTARLPVASALALGVRHSLTELVAGAAPGTPTAPAPSPDDTAAILFTSGSTGPAKGVVYTHRQLSALRDVLAAHFDVGPDTGLVTGFAPFALLGPALGTRSATPDMDVSAPRTLTARAVAAAVRASDARIVFLSPAAILNVVATSPELSDADRGALASVRSFLSTGAPVGRPVLEAAAALMPHATAHTPYGMTECLLVTDVTLEGIVAIEDAGDAGVCVGSPLGTNRVLVSALDREGRATGEPGAVPGALGEILVSAPHLKKRYDRLWLTDRAAVRDVPDAGRWHRTGDIGHLDAAGRLWIEGRLPHVIVTAEGPVAPVGPEQRIERVPGVRRAALVGIGPHGLRQPVAIVESSSRARRAGLADAGLAAAVRSVAELALAAVLVVPELPTDIRHNSKIDRTRLSAWAERTLSGGRVRRP